MGCFRFLKERRRRMYRSCNKATTTKKKLSHAQIMSLQWSSKVKSSPSPPSIGVVNSNSSTVPHRRLQRKTDLLGSYYPVNKQGSRQHSPGQFFQKRMRALFLGMSARELESGSRGVSRRLVMRRNGRRPVSSVHVRSHVGLGLE